MARLSRPSIFFLAMIVQALAHWVQELDLYADAPDGPGEKWKGCVLKSCKSPKIHQTRCHVDEQHHTLHGSELSQDAAHAANLYDKAKSIAAYMHSQHLVYGRDLKAIWANNGRALLLGHPGGKAETIQPGMADYYKVKEAKFQVESATCKAGQRLGEIRMSVSRQEIVQTDGKTDGCKDKCGVGSIAILRLNIDNLCHDCGSQVDHGFYLRVVHGSTGTFDGVADDKDVMFEFTSKKALACGSTGTFDIILSSLDSTKAVKKDELWPANVKIEIVSPCRESVAFMKMTKKDTGEKLVAPSWLGMFGR